MKGIPGAGSLVPEVTVGRKTSPSFVTPEPWPLQVGGLPQQVPVRQVSQEGLVGGCVCSLSCWDGREGAGWIGEVPSSALPCAAGVSLTLTWEETSGFFQAS
jgi:hypothetical protein